jgi:hypothetical protein
LRSLRSILKLKLPKFRERRMAEGFSLPGVLVGVALLSISATIISQTVINSKRAQKFAEAKLTSNKYQQALLDAITKRARDFMYDNCSGARWVGSGITDVEKAFAKLDIVSDGAYGLQAVFTKSTGLNPRCNDPQVANIGSGKSFHFCLQIKATAAPTTADAKKYQFAQMDDRVMELLVVPVNLATDQAIQCDEVRGAGAGLKIVWQIFNQFKNSRVAARNTGTTITKESGVILVSAESEESSETCTLSINRIGNSERCNLAVSGFRRMPKIYRDGVEIPGAGTWSNTVAGSVSTFSGIVYCSAARDAIFAAQGVSGNSCRLGIKGWFKEIGDGNPHNFATVAIPGNPIGPSVRCEPSAWGRIAVENGYSSYEYGGWWVWENMCRHNDGRYNYTSCGDNQHRDWDGSAWAFIPACGDGWTTYLKIFNPVPATFAPP